MFRICTAVAALIAGSLLWNIAVAQVRPNAALYWNKTLLTIVRMPGAEPITLANSRPAARHRRGRATLHSTRGFTILHAAIYDAVNAIDGHHAPYLIQIERIPEDASQEAAAHSAACDVLVSLHSSLRTTLDAQLQQDLAAIPDGPRKTTGVRVGQAVARATLRLREEDRSAAPQPTLDLAGKPRRHQLTPPNLPSPAIAQGLGVTPFGLRSAKQFRPGPPPALTSVEYTAVFIEVMSLGWQEAPRQLLTNS